MKTQILFVIKGQLKHFQLSLLLIPILFLLSIGNSYAQTETCISIGEIGKVEDRDYPFSGGRSHSYLQQIFTADELSAVEIVNGDQIIGLSFNYFWENPTKRPIKIFVANTSLKIFSNDGWVPISEFTEVLAESCQEFSKGTNNWTKISFTTPFTYTGGNIIVATLMNEEESENPACFTEKKSDKRFFTHATADNKSIYHFAPNNIPITFHETSGLPKVGEALLEGSAQRKRNNIRFCKIGPSCPKVSGIEANSTTNTEIALSWIPGSEETSWEVEYGEKGFIKGSGTSKNVSGNPNLLITNLNHSSEYDVYIKANCSDQSESAWIGPKTYTTACGIIVSNNYIEDFTLTNPLLNCWTIIDVDNNGTLGSAPSGKWRFYQNSAQYRYIKSKANDWLISPQITVSENMFVSFDYRSHNTSDHEKFSVWVIKGSPSNYNTEATEILETQTINNRTYLKTSPLSLADFVGQNVFIGIKCESDASKNILHIDNFRVYNPSPENQITKFSLPTQTGAANINSVDKIVDIEVSYSTVANSLSPTIEISEYASITPESGSPQDFTSQVEYTVIAEDGTPQVWKVNLTKASTPSTENNITEFKFPFQEGTFTIEGENITAYLNWEKSLKKISPTIKISDFATISPESGLVRDFSTPQKYYVTSESGAIKEWTITIKNALPPAGANCEYPLLVNLSSLDNTYSLTDETTAGYGDEYHNTSLEGYDNGFDKIYKLSVNEKSVYSINLKTKERTVAIALFNGCPSENIIIAKDTAANGVYELNLSDIVLDNNKEYYLMVDKKFNPFEIDKYNLTFTKNLNPPCLSPSSIEISDILQTSCKISWTQAFKETKWELKHGSLNFNPESEGTLITDISQNNYNLTSLTLNSEYSVYIRSKCSDTETNQWVGPFNFKTLTSCPIPTDIKVSTITTNSALVSWNGHNVDNWVFEYKLESDENFTIQQVSTNSIQLSNLSNSSTYSFRIMSKCSNNEESSYTDEIRFTTNCLNISEIPYYEDFGTHEDNENPFPSCWRRSTSFTMDSEIFPKITSGITDMSLKCLQFAAPSTIQTIASTQIFDSPIQNLVVEFKMRKNNMGSGKMIIGVMSDPNDPSTFIDVLTINPNDYPVIVEDKLDFGDYSEITGNNKAIAFKHVSNSQTSYYYLDYVRVRNKSSEKEITSFTTNGLISTGTINSENHTISGTIAHNSNPSEQLPVITISEHAKISPESGVPQDFSNSVVYTVTAEDGSTQAWTVTLNHATSASSEKNILSFTFPNQEGTAIIKESNHTVTAKVNWLSEVTDISPVIEISPFATISPTSGTSQNFTEPVEYTITAQDGSTQIWTVSIGIADQPAGATCENPVIVDLSQNSDSYTIQDETTKAFGNNYTGTQLGNFDKGQDKIYKININENSLYKISLISNTKYVGMGLFKGCPSSDNLIKSSTNKYAGEQSIDKVVLQKNQEYFLMVDKQPTPSHIDQYNLSFTKIQNPECISPNDLSVSNITQNSADFSWTQTLSENSWELLWGEIGFNPDGSQGIKIPVGPNPNHTITDFEAAKKYNIYLRSKCSDEEVGQWTGPLLIETMANCPIPTELKILSTSNTDVSITWNPSTATKWKVEHKLASQGDEDYQSKEVETNTTTIEGLSSSQSYIIRIKALCAPGQESEYSEEKHFNTSCESISSFPYFEGFDNNSPSLLCWQIVDNEIDDNNGTILPGKWKFSGNKAVYFCNGINEANDWLVSPKMNMTEGLSLSFDYSTGDNNYSQKFSVWAITEITEEGLSQATPILGTQTVNNTTPLRTSLIPLQAVSNQNVYIAIKCESPVNSSNLRIDNFRIAIPSAENDITSFSLPTQTGDASIDTEGHKVDIEVYSSTDLTYLEPTITVSDFASIDPASGAARDFTEEQTYTVTSETGATQIWKVKVNKATTDQPTEFTITSSAEENGSISPDGVTTVAAGETQIYTITPKENYQIDKVIVDNSDKISELTGGNTYTFTNVQENHSIVAKFKAIETNTISLTASVEGGNGTITPSQETVVDAGSNFEFAVKAAEGYELEFLKDNEHIKTSEVTSEGKYKLSNINEPHTIVVKFKQAGTPSPSSYTLTAEVVGGNGSVSPNSVIVAANGSQTFTITPNDGYVLAELIDNNEPKTNEVTDNKYTLTGIDKKHNIVIRLKKVGQTHNLSASVFGGNGFITPTSHKVNDGDDFEFTIKPAQGYILDNLKDNNIEKTDNVEDNKYKLTNIQENHTIVVKFKLDNSISEESILDIKIYPNPTNDLLNIELSNEISNIEILTLNGKLIHKQRVNDSNFQYQTSVLAEGNYLIKIYTVNKIITKQFSVKR